MAITLAELRTEVFGPYSYLNDAGTQAARVDRWINAAYHELCDQAPWPFLEKTFASSANLVSNPNFETDTTGWTATSYGVSVSAMTRSSAWSSTGTYSLLLTGTVSAASSYSAAYTSLVGVSPGDTIEASCDAYVNSLPPGGRVNVQILCFDSSSTLVSIANGTEFVTSSYPGAATLTCAGVVPDSATQVQLWLSCEGLTATSGTMSCAFDNVRLAPRNTAQPVKIPDLGSIIDVRDLESDATLQFATLETLAKVYTDLTTTGTPAFYYVTGGDSINTYPVTSNALSVRYRAVPVDMSAASDTPLVPDRYRDIIALGALRRAALDNQAWEAANGYRQEWDARLLDMVSAECPPPRRQQIVAGSEDQ